MKFAVLVVDDDPLVNEFLTEVLTRSGYECTSVHSGEEAMVRFNDGVIVYAKNGVGVDRVEYQLDLTGTRLCAVNSLTMGGQNLARFSRIHLVRQHTAGDQE